MAAAIEDSGIGASGSQQADQRQLRWNDGLLAALADGFAAPSAERLNADMRKTANAAVAIILALNLIVASRTARRDHQKISAPD